MLGCILMLFSAPSAAQLSELIEGQIAAFEASDFTFQAAESNAPFPPIAFLNYGLYNESEVDIPGEDDLNYEIQRVSLAAGVPFIPSKRDLVALGGYFSRTEFRNGDNMSGDFSVSSFGVPVGWLRQLEAQKQVAAFAMPIVHKASLEGSERSYQYRAGLFGLNYQRRELFWVYGLYVDVNDSEDFALPYVGASWVINEYWTLSAILPWPSITYAPNHDWAFSLGASPSGASWTVRDDDEEIAANFDAWDFGISVDRRLTNFLWASFEAGFGGFRGLRFTMDGVEGPEVELEDSGYVALSLDVRPPMD